MWFLAEIIKGCHRLCNRITLQAQLIHRWNGITMGWSLTYYTHCMVFIFSISKCVSAPISHIWHANGRAVRYIRMCTEHRLVRINCDSNERIITSYRMRNDRFPLESHSRTRRVQWQILSMGNTREANPFCICCCCCGSRFWLAFFFSFAQLWTLDHFFPQNKNHGVYDSHMVCKCK